MPVDESHPLNPKSNYGKSKLEGERLCKKFSEEFGTKCIILRLCNIYGLNDNNKGRLIPSIIKGIVNNKEIKLTSQLPKREFIFMDGVIEAFLKAIEYDVENIEIFNIGEGVSHSVKEVLELFLKYTKYNGKVEYSGLKEGEIMDIFFDISKAKSKLEWSPRTGLEEGINRVVKDINLPY